jgi:tetratricopeptide (TPR) repeat protein
MARLDRLGPAKEIAQIGATIGREFAHEILAVVAKKSEPELAASLDRLLQAGLLFRQGQPPHATYLFKHALIQDAAYGNLLRGRRQQLHADIARSVSAHSPTLANVQPETVAHHLTEAGLSVEAIQYWLAAGQLASARSAYVEAVAHLERGLRLTATLPEGQGNEQQEFSFQVALGAALVAMKGYASVDAERAYLRARDLLDKRGETERIEEALTGLQIVWYNQGEFVNAANAGRRMVSIAETRADKILSCVAHRSVAGPSFMLGDFQSAFFHARASVGDFDPKLHSGLASRFGHDIGVGATGQYCIATLARGDFVASAKARVQAIELAEQSEHTNTIAYALYYAGVLPASMARDMDALKERATGLVDFASRHALPQWVAWGSNFLAPCFLNVGEPEAAIEASRKAIAACDQLGNKAFRPLFLSFLSEALFATGRIGDANETLSSAMAFAGRSKEHWYLAGLCVCKGAFETVQGSKELAEISFRRALEIAHQQGARLFELRAATNLARLMRAQGQRDDARDLLLPVYRWFSGGFEARDLEEAKELLDQMAA